MTVFVVLLSCLNIVLWAVLFSVFKKKCSPDAVLEQIKDEVNKLIIDISRETDKDITLLEGRIQGLRSLMEEADRRTALADKEEYKRARGQAVLDLLQPQAKPVNRAAPAVARAAAAYAAESIAIEKLQPPAQPAASEQGDLFVAAETAPPAAEEAPFPQFPEQPAPDLTVSFPSVSVSPEPIVPKKDIRTQVLDMASDGFSPDIIAEKLSISVTEVELFTNMYSL